MPDNYEIEYNLHITFDGYYQIADPSDITETFEADGLIYDKHAATGINEYVGTLSGYNLGELKVVADKITAAFKEYCK